MITITGMSGGGSGAGVGWRELAPRVGAALQAGGGERMAAVRALLEGRWGGGPLRAEGAVWPSGVAGVDAALGGGLHGGAVTELVAAGPSAGVQTLLLAWVRAVRAARRWVAWVDAADGLDPAELGPGEARGLVWVRARGAREALAAMDALARDGDVALVLGDLRGAPAATWRGLQDTAWYRLQRVVREQGGALLVATESRRVPSAAWRLRLGGRWQLADLGRARPELAQVLLVEVERARVRWGEAAAG